MPVIDLRTGLPVTNIAEREAAQSGTSSVPVATRLAVGCTFQNGMLRTHRYSDHMVLWDLTNAGKRGKQVTKLNLCPSYTVSNLYRNAIMEQIAILLEGLQSFAVAAAMLGELASSKQFDLSSAEERGVDVAPASFKAITIQTEILSLTVSYTDFSIRCLKEKHNEPAACPRDKNLRKAVQQFYTWVSANQDQIKAMSYHEVLNAMLKQGIQYHSYCAID